jgi:hypothetical protein
MADVDEQKVQKELPVDLDNFSSSSIRRAVRNESLLHPLVLFPAAVGLLSGFAALLYDLPILFMGMGGLLAVGAGTSVINYFFREEKISGQYLEKLSQEFQKKRERILVGLGDDLGRCLAIPGAESYGHQGVEQFAMIAKKYDRLSDLLKKKFKTGELAYGSFLGAAEQVHLSVLDNLLKIVTLMQSVETIDPAYLASRAEELRLLKQVTPADEREFESLRTRSELREDLLQQINTLLTENEESMTVMDETIAAIAELQTGKGLAEVDLQTAMSHLREIAGRTSLYKKG